MPRKVDVCDDDGVSGVNLEGKDRKVFSFIIYIPIFMPIFIKIPKKLLSISY